MGDSPTAAGGLEPYSYQWLPETDLDDATQANPVYSGSEEQTFTLEVIDNRGCTARDTVLVSITGLSDVPEENLLLVYPNPGAGFIKLSMKESKEGLPREIRMFDATGKLIISEQWNAFHEDYLIDVTSLSAGSYIISVGQGKDVITRQFIISK